MKKQIKSFGHAFEGLLSAIRSESHLRFHLVAAFYVFLFAGLGEFDTIRWVLLTLTVCFVIFAELVNTAIEEVCDLYSTERNLKIKRIKDISAGAVLISATGAVAVAVWLFLAEGRLVAAFGKIVQAPLWFIPLGLSAVLSILFIAFFKAPKKDK